MFFQASTGSLNLRKKCISVTVIHDFMYEKGAEIFDVVLGIDINTSGVIINPNVTQVTIMDSDGKSSLFDVSDNIPPLIFPCRTPDWIY